MKKHVSVGIDIVAQSDWLRDAVAVVGCHHEKYAGGGYPDGLTDDAIPLNARIFAIADVFDALTSERPYKNRSSLKKRWAFWRRDGAAISIRFCSTLSRSLRDHYTVNMPPAQRPFSRKNSRASPGHIFRKSCTTDGSNEGSGLTGHKSERD